jgi:hypothetical protein
MCPFCIATAMMIAGGVTSTSGVAAFAIRKLGVKNVADNNPLHPHPSCSEKRRSMRNRPEPKSKELSRCQRA